MAPKPDGGAAMPCGYGEAVAFAQMAGIKILPWQARILLLATFGGAYRRQWQLEGPSLP